MPREVDQKLLAAVERLGRALRVARQTVATDLRLSLLQLQIIEQLHTLGQRRVGLLALELDVTQPTISDALTALEHKSLVGRSSDPDDRRATIAFLTAEGKASGSTAATALAPILADSAVTSDDDKATALHVMLEEIHRLQRAGVISINRSCLSCEHYQAPVATTIARCLLLDTELRPVDLRVECAEHKAMA